MRKTDAAMVTIIECGPSPMSIEAQHGLKDSCPCETQPSYRVCEKVVDKTLIFY